MTANCKECEDCVIITDIPSPKECKLEPEEILLHKLIPELLMKVTYQIGNSL